MVVRCASAFSEAQTHLQRGLNLLPHVGDQVLSYKTELGLQTFLGLCFLSTQGYGAEQSIAAFSRAEELLSLDRVPGKP